MNRSARANEQVDLSVGDWVRILGLVLALVAATWKFTLDISGELRVVQTKLERIEERIHALEHPKPRS